MAERPASLHPYPSNHRPGTHWATDEAWTILDTLPVGMLPAEQRFVIGGLIAGALMRIAKDRDDLLRAAVHALRSYEFGNASPEIAKSVADKCEAGLKGAAHG